MKLIRTTFLFSCRIIWTRGYDNPGQTAYDWGQRLIESRGSLSAFTWSGHIFVRKVPWTLWPRFTQCCFSQVACTLDCWHRQDRPSHHFIIIQNFWLRVLTSILAIKRPLNDSHCVWLNYFMLGVVVTVRFAQQVSFSRILMFSARFID